MTFSMFINTVGDRRQHDTYLDNLTQLKKAFFTWQAAETSQPTPAAEPSKLKKPKKQPKKQKKKPKGGTTTAKTAKTRAINYETFMTWARKHCGSLSFIDGQSEGTPRTNLRIANNLTMDSIRWLITIVAAERTERRAAALADGISFNETTKVGRGIYGGAGAPG